MQLKNPTLLNSPNFRTSKCYQLRNNQNSKMPKTKSKIAVMAAKLLLSKQQ